MFTDPGTNSSSTANHPKQESFVGGNYCEESEYAEISSDISDHLSGHFVYSLEDFQQQSVKENSGIRTRSAQRDVLKPSADCKHAQETVSFACSYCSHTSQTYSKLMSHMRIHSARHACSVCDYKTQKSSHMKRHMRGHTGEKPYTCDVCDRRFADNGDAKRHMRIHTGEKPYKCDICQQGFSKKVNMKKHMGIHTRREPSR